MTDSQRSAPGERLAKVIARAGLCSRRDAEGWIKEGRVAVNGSVIRTPAFNVAQKDRITVDGAPLQMKSGTRLWLYHKPPGLVVTEKDPEGRPTIFEALEAEGLPRVLTVGRLDINTEGLLLLTNDGGLKRVLELPATGWLRRYRVRAFGSISQARLDGLKAGAEIEGVKYGPIEATLEREQGANVWLLVALREGKNREVKNVLGTLGLTVNRLIRVSYGPFQLGELPAGKIEVVRARVLRDQLGKKLADEAGVDFESEMPEAATQRGRSARGPRRELDAAPVRTGRPRRIHFDDGRPPEEFVPPPERKPREERGAGDERPPRGDRRDASSPRKYAAARDVPPRTSPRRTDRPGGRPHSGRGRPDAEARSPRPSGPPPTRPSGSRSPRSEGARSQRPEGQRPARPSGPRPPRSGSPRPAGSRPSRPGTPRPPRPAGSRPPRPGGTRPPRKPRP